MFDIRRLKDIRKKLGITQQAFAKRANVSQSLIAKIEAGAIDPSYSNVLKLEQTVNDLTNIKEPSAQDVMNPKIIFVKPDDKVSDVIKVMRKNSISQVIVEEENKIVGLITEGSLLEKDLSKLQQLRAKDVMLDPPPVVANKTKLSVLSAILTQYPLVVIQKESKFVGVATKSDLLNHLV
ncbi:CBS domain-containing protein [Candidatus Woesearchaeota archaeon]|nr:CBS domain-containing protein [Candidatus Woesearchaeota archaeon]